MKIKAYTLLTTAALFVGYAGPALAQNAEAAKTQSDSKPLPAAEKEGNDEGTILVTGSRIARPEFSGVIPGVQINAEQIETRGFTNAIDILNDSPLVGPGASPNGTNGGQNASLGAAFVDLLDLGTQRTLTLVNGRRFVSGNAASLFVAGNESGAQVDANAIPAALISRIDVVTVGGAAAYGSDAIAGVVNYILRTDFEGLRLSAIAGLSGEGDTGRTQLSFIAGKNLLDDRLNVVLSGEYNRTEGLQANQREERLLRAGGVANFNNGATRNPNFTSAIITAAANNGAFLSATTDLVPATQFNIQGIVNQGLSFNGSVFNTLATPGVNYTPTLIGGIPNVVRFSNGIGQSGSSFFNTATQIIPGLPTGNGRNGLATAAAGVPLTTFAPTSLPAGVTAAAVFTQFGITPPVGATATQLTTLAVNVLQANRPTAREFFAANPNVSTNAFLGTFFAGVPRVANTDTTLVNVRGVLVPVNQVLPFVAVPLELTDDGNFRSLTNATLTPTTQSTFNQAVGSNGGFTRAIENVVLRTQQDRYIGNLNLNFEITPNIRLFSENLYSNVTTVSLRNSPSQNFLTTGVENAALVLNVNNPFLDAGDLAVLNSAGINAATRGGSFVITRQNQDIFGDNPQRSNVETIRFVGGVEGKGKILGREFTAEASVTYGKATQLTNTTQINDIEYQLALDTARDGNNVIRCRAQLFPAQYLGFTPVGVVSNTVRTPGTDGIPTDRVFTPTITQSQIDSCAPLNPFGYNQLSDAAKAYVRQDNVINNVSTQTFVAGSFTTSLFDLPAGELGVSLNAEYRKETLDFSTDALNQLGRGRAAPSAQTSGKIETLEGGGEARIPIFGDDFVPLLGSLEINPAVRFSRQTGSGSQFRNFAGQIVNPTFKGDAATIFSLAATWRVIPDITLRGNITRSIRQPSIVELFLGGQPAFSAPGDPCSSLAIDTGNFPGNRRTNCQNAVVAAGLAANTDAAAAFLSSFIANPGALAGLFVGNGALQPERGRSYTYGTIITPRFLPNLTVSADFISLDLSNSITVVGLANLTQLCFDAPGGNSTAQIGFNSCNSFSRDAAFQIAPNYSSTFLNLGGIQIRAININGQYRIDLPGKLGRATLRSNAYHLKRYNTSSSGNFDDTAFSAGTPARPNWEVQSSVRYDGPVLFSQVTWNWTSSSRAFTAGRLGTGAVATIDNASILDFPSYSLFDLSLGAQVTDKLRMTFIVSNLADKRFYADISQANFIDSVGRRFQLSVNAKF